MQALCQGNEGAEALLKTAIGWVQLFGRVNRQVLKIARTAGDLAERASIEPVHVSEAVQHPSLDRTVR